MNEQKEIRWWEKGFEDWWTDVYFRLETFEPKKPMMPPGETAQEVKAYVAQVELAARKDERERVIGEVEKFRNSYEGEDFDARVEAYTENSLLDKISTALKSLSGNNE